jgi:diguanylate cyclase (GGDEF)-like protein/PAS domain S-box-containing protein
VTRPEVDIEGVGPEPDDPSVIGPLPREPAPALLHDSHDLHVLIDDMGRLRWASERITTMLGYAVPAIVGRHVLELVHPEDVSAAVAGFQAMLRRHLRDGIESIADDSLVARVRTGDRRWVRVEAACASVVPGVGGTGGALVQVRNVAWPRSAEDAVRKSEERARALVQHSADAVVVVDARGRIAYASPTVERLFGWPAAEVEGREWMPFVAEEDHGLVAEALSDLVSRSTDQLYTGRFRVRHQTGGWRWVETISVNHLDNPAIGGIVTNVRDVTGRIEADEALRTSEARFRTVVSGAYDVTAVIGCDGVVRWVTPNCERLLGCPPAAIVGRSGLDWVHPDNLDEMVEALTVFAAGDGVSYPAPIRMRHQDGSWRDVEVVATDFLDHPDIAGIAVNLRDIGERIAAERERERLTQIFAMTTDLVSTYDLEGRLVYVNDAVRRFVGVAPDAPIEAIDVDAHLTPSARKAFRTEAHVAIGAGRSWCGELELIDVEGRVVPMHAQLLGHRDGEGRLLHISGVMRDISERKEFERRLRHEATHDPLTALPNRTLLLDRLTNALERSRRNGSGIAVLFCDLDNFKVVNDSLGHSHGDRVLTEVAQRLREQLRPGDTVARFGGDEFVILCEDCQSTVDAVGIAERVDAALRRSFELDGSEIFVGVSIGIALSGPGSDRPLQPESLIRDADVAMYRAKEQGRGRYRVFEPMFLTSAVDRLDLESSLRRAIDRGELDLVYQPVVNLAAPGPSGLGSGQGGPSGRGSASTDGLAPGRIVGAEALVRWDHPQRGRLLPGEFIPLAEDIGVVHELGAWVLETACLQLARWLADAPQPAAFSMAVNLSGRQLDHPGLVDLVAGVLRATGVPPVCLDLEVTESAVMQDVTSSAAMLASLKDLGVNIAVDDFGTGYSSLAYLRRFPVDRLKVDRSFIRGLGTEPEDSAIVGAVVGLAHALGLVAVAEGVETSDQVEALRSLDCDLAQGYHFGRPACGDELERWLETTRC